jgi:N-acetylneuraminate synthase
MSPREDASRAHRRSLFVTCDVKAGERLSAENVRSVRPGNGLPPKHLAQVLGRKATRDLAAGSPLAWDMIG